MRSGILTTLALLMVAGCNRPEPTDAETSAVAPAAPPTSASFETPAAPLELTAPASPWKVSRNQTIGEDNFIALSYSENLSLVVRQTGKKLECYITDADPLETMDKMPRILSHVEYGFDRGEMVSKDWIRSDRATALFYPGDVKEFIQDIRKAKRLVIEYQPTGKLPQTTSFNVSLFPYEMFEGLNN